MSVLSRRALSLRVALRRRSLKLHTLDSFRFRPFRSLWVAVLLTSSGQWLQQVVVGWLAYDVTRSPLLTALAMGMTALPNLVGSPVGGVLSDRYDRTRVLAVVYGFKGAVAAGFAALVMTGRLEAWHIFAFVLARGFLESISWPTRLSLIPRIVPRDYLSNAFALTILTSSAARLAVPAAAGVLIVVLGPGPTLLAGTVTYLGASVTVATIRLPRADQARDRVGSVIGELLEAARYVKGEPVLLPVLLMGAAVYMLIVSTVHGLMPVYAAEVFHVGPAGLGLMTSALGMGAALGTLVLASLGDLRHRGRVILGALTVTVGGALAFSASPALVIALPVLVLLNGGFDTFAAVRSATIQAIAPDAMRGRASALNGMGTGMFTVGSLLLGGVAELYGARWATLIAASLMAVCLAGINLRFRSVWRLE